MEKEKKNIDELPFISKNNHPGPRPTTGNWYQGRSSSRRACFGESLVEEELHWLNGSDFAKGAITYPS
jgi:hypothetical protein